MTDTLITDPNHPGTKTVPPELLTAVEDRWIGRCQAQGKKLKGAVYDREEIEFFCGAMSVLAALDYKMPPKWAIAGFRGDRIVEAARFK